ncbi:GNAT family protein [Aminobacter sp. MDW-2]|uniref:GNAT family N-acetyltransferase n=1 Tax=Aminobacter sp. MDW-2 TaxID=2666139 RepID=UPI0012AF20C7|nr:GNAT family protein [Aminobacter sp. MDW-2]MRX32800.1 N-acetyltransferase [Aminobacter sp. MDW-2]QNH34539.1 GNAT family N-acetyltransferase [Aminobacter sp. MDW-2]
MNDNRYIYGEDERLVEWVSDRIDGCLFRDDAKAIGHERDGELVAAVVFDGFSPTSCFVSVAASSRRWITPEFAVRVMAYPFVQCGFPRINCVVAASNRLSLRLTRQFGWVEEGRLREGALDGGDMILFGMLRRECRFLPPTVGTTGISAL